MMMNIFSIIGFLDHWNARENLILVASLLGTVIVNHRGG
jgi:hypothetical protein